MHVKVCICGLMRCTSACARCSSAHTYTCTSVSLQVDLANLIESAGAKAAPSPQKDTTPLMTFPDQISLSAYAAPSCDSSASTHSSREEQARSDVSILLGGCGDARHFLATLIDAVAECRSADLTGAWLRFVLNDVQPEVLARAAILMQLLQRAADALPDGTPLVCEPEELSEDAIVALTDLWHVYHAPALLPHAYTALEGAMQAIVASKEPPLPWLQATPGSWAHVQNVCDAWLQQKLCMTEMEELMAQSDKARTGPNMTEAYIPDHIRV